MPPPAWSVLAGAVDRAPPALVALHAAAESCRANSTTRPTAASTATSPASNDPFFWEHCGHDPLRFHVPDRSAASSHSVRTSTPGGGACPPPSAPSAPTAGSNFPLAAIASQLANGATHSSTLTIMRTFIGSSPGCKFHALSQKAQLRPFSLRFALCTPLLLVVQILPAFVYTQLSLDFIRRFANL